MPLVTASNFKTLAFELDRRQSRRANYTAQQLTETLARNLGGLRWAVDTGATWQKIHFDRSFHVGNLFLLITIFLPDFGTGVFLAVC